MRKFVSLLFLLWQMMLFGVEEADSIFFNGEIYTVNEAMPYVEAVCVKSGKIIFCGKKDEALVLKSNKTRMIDLDSKTLLPGFIDPHTHVLMEAMIRTNLNVRPETHKTFEQVLDALKLAAKQGPVLALEYDPSLMEKSGFLGFETLDAISTSVPILVINRSWHIAYANSLAFALAGITDATKDPLGATFERDEEGKLTGVADEIPAISLLAASFPIIQHTNFLHLGTLIAKIYARNGYTTVTDMGLGFPLPTPLGAIETMQRVANDPQCPIRLQGYVVYSLLDKIKELQQDNSDRFRILGMKIWADGSLQGYTAALNNPYHDKNTLGTLNFSQKELSSFVVDAHKKGLQIAVHANGDKAIEEAINAFQQALAERPDTDPRFRIEHCTLANPSLFERMVKCKATPSFSEEHVYNWGKVFQEKILGRARAKYLDAAATAKKLGLKFSFNDDILGSLNPLLFIQVAVTRQTDSGTILNPHERISVEEAIKAMTIYPAWQCFREKELGSIEVGKFADFVLLDKNPTKVPENTIKDIAILGTWLNGKKVS